MRKTQSPKIVGKLVKKIQNIVHVERLSRIAEPSKTFIKTSDNTVYLLLRRVILQKSRFRPLMFHLSQVGFPFLD